MGDSILLERQAMGATEELERTADSATTTTLVDATLTEADDFWNNSILRTIRGTGLGQRRTVSDFVSVGAILTISSAWDTDPAIGSLYILSRPAAAGDMFRGMNVNHDPQVEKLAREVKDSSISPFASVSGKRSGSFSFSTELRGSGAAGTAPDYGLLFQACGFAETVDPGVSVIYAPTSDKANYKKICLTLYQDGLRIMYFGCMGTFSLGASLDGVPVINWEFTAADFDIADAAIVSGTYDAQVPEPVLRLGASLGGFNFDISSLEIAVNNEVALRQSSNTSGGHINAIVTKRAPTGSFDPEGVLKATHDVFAAWEAGTLLALAAQVGQAAGNICTITAPKVEYTGLGLGDREGVIVYEAPFGLSRNTGDDELVIAFT